MPQIVPNRTDSRAITTPAEWDTAVGVTDGPQLVLAGPGTGKTQFLAERAARLIGQGVPAGSILVLTFSRRSASELERRITGLLKRPASGATASTFHRYAHGLLELDLAPRDVPMPVLLTGPEQVRLVHELLATENPNDWPLTFRSILTSDTFVSEVADFVMRCHERLLDPAGLAALAQPRADWRALPAFLARYRAALEDRERIDYATLLARAVLLTNNPPQEDDPTGYSYVLVDEYQDTSPAQARLAEQATREGNITVAADPHQSIYSFRGAEIDNVEEFPDRILARFGVTPEVVLLARSFRVPAEILAAAERLVAGNATPEPGRELPTFPIEPAVHPGRVDVHTFDQRSAEAEWIAGEIERMHVSERIPLSSMAVVVRSTRHLLPELSRALDRRQLPHDRPDTRLVDHPAIRIVYDVVIAAASPPEAPEADLAVRRLLLGPLLALPLGRERELLRRRLHGISWHDLIDAEIPGAAGLAGLIANDGWARSQPAVDGFWDLWDRLPGLERIVGDPDRADFRGAWSTFARILERQAERDPSVTLFQWLVDAISGDFEATPLLSFTRPDEDRLVVTTLHQAKGLEFEIVFIADAIEGIFPDTRRSRSLLRPELLAPSRTTDPAVQTGFRLAEERRLAYTASTRARSRVVWTATTAGIDEGEHRPSRFLLAAAGVDNFDQLGPPPLPDDTGRFEPLTLSDAESRLRRFVADPEAGPVDRLAALRTLIGSTRWAPQFFAGVPAPGPDTGLIGTNVHLSPSQATSYDQCPRRYAIERRLGAIEGDSPYALFGSIIHEVLELAEGEPTTAGASHADAATAIRHLETVWEAQADFGSPALNDVWFQRGVNLLEKMYSDWPGGDRPAVKLEMELNSTIEGIEWMGRADRIDRGDDGGIIVVDYKTSRTPPSLKDAARSLQLGYYLLAAAQHPDLVSLGSPTGAELWYPASSGKRTIFPFEMENMAEVRDKLVEVGRGVTREDWTPRLGRHCDRCPVKSTCPAWPDGREGYR